MEQLSPRHSPRPNACAQREIDEIAQALGRTPVPLPQRSAIRIRIEPDRQVSKRALKRAKHIGMLPAQFRRGRDGSIVGRTKDQIQRTKARDPDRLECLVPLVLLSLKPGNHLSQESCGIISRREHDPAVWMSDILRSAAHGTDNLRATSLHAPDEDLFAILSHAPP
jgi:hypothetical protein